MRLTRRALLGLVVVVSVSALSAYANQVRSAVTSTTFNGLLKKQALVAFVSPELIVKRTIVARVIAEVPGTALAHLHVAQVPRTAGGRAVCRIPSDRTERHAVPDGFRGFRDVFS